MSYVVKNPAKPQIVKDWPVVVPTALDGGKNRKDEIFVDFEIVTFSEQEEVRREAERLGESADGALLDRVVKSINGQVDEQNLPLEFNAQTFAEAKDRTNQRQAMVTAYYDVLAGRKAIRKN